MNGATLPQEHGFPVRVVVPGLYGYVSACKWVVDMELTTFGAFSAYWTQRGWSRRRRSRPSPASTRRRPAHGAHRRLTVMIAGVAWAQHRGIEAVEVAVDGTWQPADAGGPGHDRHLAAVVLPVEGDARQAHAPGAGDRQDRATRRPPPCHKTEPNGATGYHTVHAVRGVIARTAPVPGSPLALEHAALPSSHVHVRARPDAQHRRELPGFRRGRAWPVAAVRGAGCPGRRRLPGPRLPGWLAAGEGAAEPPVRCRLLPPRRACRPGALQALVADRRADLAGVMLSRRTQTNEAARCAALLPLLARLPQPLALLEVGASAGLTLLPDRYSYDYGGHLVPGTDPLAPVLACEPRGPVPLPDRVPEVAWRAGLDLNPLDVGRDDDMHWLDCLIWPGEAGRRERLRAAIATARRDPPPLYQGDLLTDVPALARQRRRRDAGHLPLGGAGLRGPAATPGVRGCRPGPGRQVDLERGARRRRRPGSPSGRRSGLRPRLLRPGDGRAHPSSRHRPPRHVAPLVHPLSPARDSSAG